MLMAITLFLVVRFSQVVLFACAMVYMFSGIERALLTHGSSGAGIGRRRWSIPTPLGHS